MNSKRKKTNNNIEVDGPNLENTEQKNLLPLIMAPQQTADLLQVSIHTIYRWSLIRAVLFQLKARVLMLNLNIKYY